MVHRYREKKKQMINQGDDSMAILARNCNSVIMIDKDKSEKFLEDSKRNVIKPEFLEQCKKMALLFKRENKSDRK